MLQDYEEAKRYREHRDEFYEHMLWSIINLVVWMGTTTVPVGFLIITVLIDVSEPTRTIIRILALLGVIYSMIVARRYLDSTLAVAYRVGHFSEYEAQVNSMLDSENADPESTSSDEG
jgi:hypothetical protein